MCPRSDITFFYFWASFKLFTKIQLGANYLALALPPLAVPMLLGQKKLLGILSPNSDITSMLLIISMMSQALETSA
jgi:hypothetical protein